MESDSVHKFNKLHEEAEVLFLVYYRGNWCPFCQSDLKQLQSSIVARNGVIVAVTADPESKLPKMRAASGYTGEMIVDKQNFLAKELRRHDLLNVAISERKGYKHGMAQPAVLVLRKDGTVLFKWTIVSGFMNVGGTKDHLSLQEVWDNVEAQLKSGEPVHKKISSIGAMGALMEKISSIGAMIVLIEKMLG